MRSTWISAGVALALVAGLGAYAWHQRKAAALWAQVAAQAKSKAQEEASRADEAERWAEGYIDRANEAGQRATKAERELADLRRTIPVSRLAGTTPEVTQNLAKAGLPGVKVYDDHEPSKLNRSDAVKVWAWQEDAAMVPSLKATLVKAEELAGTRKMEVDALRLAVTFTEESRDSWHAAHDSQRLRAEAVEREVSALRKSQKAQTVQKWLYVAGALAGGYLAGRALR